MSPPDAPLARYQVMEPLGQGAQGTTFRGVDRKTGANVAIKVLSLKGGGGWKSFDRFEREIATLRSLRHPGIPRYLDNYAFESSGDFFLVMELVEGRNLHQALTPEAALSSAKVRVVFDRILDVLEYLHGLPSPIFHRDIKPANILMRPDGSVVLVDFGGVRQMAQDGDGESGASTMIGTIGYMAPEQLHGEVTARTDLYALAATTVALLVGKPAEALTHDGLRIDLSGLRLPSKLARVLPRMLEPEPGKRLANVAAVRAALAAPPRPRASPKAPPSAAPPRPGRPHAGANTRASTPGTALATIPEGAQALAKVPAPLSVVVWILASLASGGLLFFEAVFLPFFFQLVTVLQNRPKTDPNQVEFQADYDRFRASVKRTREAASHVADGTRPTG